MGKDMNKPVAWMYRYGSHEDDWEVSRTKWSDDDIPLYTHPVKELTDEEIIDIAYEYDGISDLVRFAKIILRKAQEK